MNHSDALLSILCILYQENHWDGDCTNRYESLYSMSWASSTLSWSRLFTMNHFCCGTGLESFERIRTDLPGGGDNGWGILYGRVLECAAATGLNRKPNFIAVDWAHIGDVKEIADYLTFGGKIGGIGDKYMCRSGLDCATGSCSRDHQCQCQLCDAKHIYCSGCNAGESCVSIRDGIHECTSNVSQLVTSSSGPIERNPYILLTCAAAIVVFLLDVFR